jgi:hypothetical protein
MARTCVGLYKLDAMENAERTEANARRGTAGSVQNLEQGVTRMFKFSNILVRSSHSLWKLIFLSTA